MKSNHVNKKFQIASPAEKRIIIAKDVLKRLKLGRILITSGVFVNFNYFSSIENIYLKKYINKELQTILPKIKQCAVCALGSLFLSQVKMANNCKLSENDIKCAKLSMCEKIKQIKYFSLKQLTLIEMAFENGYGYFCHNNSIVLTDDEYFNAIEFYNIYPNDKDRLVAILENIIENNGKFVLK